jgi:hypothetical protein
MAPVKEKKTSGMANFVLIDRMAAPRDKDYSSVSPLQTFQTTPINEHLLLKSADFMALNKRSTSMFPALQQPLLNKLPS